MHMTWSEVYEIWNHTLDQMSYVPNRIPEIKEAVITRGIAWEGYDWVPNHREENRINEITDNPSINFMLYGDTGTNKGTRHTVGMFHHAKTEEERAAIWIAAVLHEIAFPYGNDPYPEVAEEMYYAALGFLKKKQFIWHWSSKKWIPDDVSRVLYVEKDKDNKYIYMRKIQMAVVVLLSTHTMIWYHGRETENV